MLIGRFNNWLFKIYNFVIFFGAIVCNLHTQDFYFLFRKIYRFVDNFRIFGVDFCFILVRIFLWAVGLLKIFVKKKIKRFIRKFCLRFDWFMRCGNYFIWCKFYFELLVISFSWGYVGQYELVFGMMNGIFWNTSA